MKLISLICLLCTACCSDGYKFLVCFPFPVRSLNLLGEGVVKHLLGNGHEVTYITSFPILKKDDKNLRQIDIKELIPYLHNDEMLNITKVMENRDVFNDIQGMHEMVLNMAILALQHEKVDMFLKDAKEEFDAVIVDYFETEIYSGLAAIYNCPMIWFYSLGTESSILSLIHEPTNPTYNTDYMSNNVLPLNFVARIEELWWQLKWYGLKRFISAPKEEAAYEKIFTPYLERRGRTLPNYQDLIYNASLVLSNVYFTFGNIPSTPQNFKFIGGQHIDTPAKPLPKDLQTLMDNSKDGVIYFSLGSTWKSKDIPPSLTEGLLKLFGELKQTVIWKYEVDLKNVPKNVNIIKWAPQHSILAHPNCLFFITHGGMLSSTEAIHFSVPIIGIPIFMDQFININKAVMKGYALKADLNYDLPQNLRTAIKMMLSDQTYKNKVKELSVLYHDRLVPPGTELVYWVEHVVRTRGAPHLRSPALHVPLYQKLYLDLIALIVVALIVLKTVFKRLFCVNNKRNNNKKNSKKYN